MYKRAFLLFAAFLSISATTYFLLKPNPKKQAETALLHLKNAHFSAAERALKSPASLPSGEEFLYRGYVEQGRGRFTASDQILQAAYIEAKKIDNQELLMETLLANAINAYLEGRDAEFFFHVSTAQEYGIQLPALAFFEGLQSYLRHAYAEALGLWNGFSLEESGEWMVASLERYFPFIWLKTHKAHCLIEQGEILAAREILEKEGRTLEMAHEQHPLCTLFLGLSYLKEAQQTPLEQRGTFYTMARFYLQRARIGEMHCREKNRVIVHLEDEAKTLLTPHLDEEKRRWGFECVRTLQEWKARPSIERLAEHVLERVMKQPGTECVQFCQALRQEFLATSFHDLLTHKINNALANAIKSGEVVGLAGLWEITAALSPSPKLAAKEIATLATAEIFDTIRKDTALLANTRTFISFWEKLDRSSVEREFLAHDLLFHAKLFWHNEEQEQKGFQLMEMALDISNDALSVNQEIASFLTQLYCQAENCNMIRRLSLIYDAIEHFEISRPEPRSKATLANHLADAEYLYEVRNYPAASTHANWILKLKPDDQRARRLAGLCSFNLGEYAQALCHLQALQNPDEDACKALMLAQVLAAQEPGKHLCQIDASFDDDE